MYVLKYSIVYTTTTKMQLSRKLSLDLNKIFVIATYSMKILEVSENKSIVILSKIKISGFNIPNILIFPLSN